MRPQVLKERLVLVVDRLQDAGDNAEKISAIGTLMRGSHVDHSMSAQLDGLMVLEMATSSVVGVCKCLDRLAMLRMHYGT